MFVILIKLGQIFCPWRRAISKVSKKERKFKYLTKPICYLCDICQTRISPIQKVSLIYFASQKHVALQVINLAAVVNKMTIQTKICKLSIISR